MMTVWKYPLTQAPGQLITLPKGARILSVAWARGQIVVYAYVDSHSTQTETRRVTLVSTGHPALLNDGPGAFVGTLTSGDALVWHVFVGPPIPTLPPGPAIR